MELRRLVLPLAAAAAALGLAACRGADVIPFRATKLLHGYVGSLDRDTVTIHLLNGSEYELTELTIEVTNQAAGSSRAKTRTFEVPLELRPGAEIAVRLPVTRGTWTDVDPPRPRDFNSDFIVVADDPEWSVAIPVVRGHRPKAMWGDNYLRSIFWRHEAAPAAR